MLQFFETIGIAFIVIFFIDQVFNPLLAGQKIFQAFRNKEKRKLYNQLDEIEEYRDYLQLKYKLKNENEKLEKEKDALR